MFVRLTTVVTILMSCELMVLPAFGQRPSASDQRAIFEQQRMIEAGKPQEGVLNVAGLKVGAKGMPSSIDAKVMQVIDQNSMLVGVEDARINNGKYETWVMVKCSTKGITDGKFWRGGQWKEVTGSDNLEVTGTTTYKTAAGGTKTVFVFEPVKAPVRVYGELTEEEKKKHEGPTIAEMQNAARDKKKQEELERKQEQLRLLHEADRELKRVKAEKAAQQKAEARANTLLKYAKKLIDRGDDNSKAKTRLKEIVDEFPDTEAGKEAKAILKSRGW